MSSHAAVEPDDKAENEAQSAQTPDVDARQVLADVVWLMMSAPNHKHLFLADLEWLVIPPVLAGQFRVFKQNGVPVGYASWAYLTEEAEQRLKSGDLRLKPDEWNAGDRAWLIDLTAPFGGASQMVEELKQQVFGGDNIGILGADKVK